MPPTPPSRGRPFFAVLVAFLAVALVACDGAPERPNVLLVTLDTTRADRVGCYGYPGAATPTLDSLARAGARFDRAVAQAPLTLASHTTVLTGLYSREHGMHVNGGARLGEGIPTLAERLRDDGYRTAAFVASFVLDASFGLDRGFDLYDDTMGTGAPSTKFESERPADRVVDAALAWLSGSSAQPFFAWVHFYDPHSPYLPPASYRARFDDPYDGEIAFVDDQLARLLSRLDDLGLRERTLIVVAGDHGESFGEHGEKDHGLLVYDTTVRVPLIVSWPGRLPAGTVAAEPAQLADVFPTVLELAGLAAEPEVSGRSLVPALRSETVADRPAYGESRYGQIGYGWAPLRFVVADGWKYVEAPRPELYALDADPQESTNRLADEPARADALRETLLALEREHPPRESEDVDLDADAIARLRSLGYVGGGSRPVDLDASIEGLRDPKDMLDVYREHLAVGDLLYSGRFAEAVPAIEGLLARSPESFDIYADLGYAYLGVGRVADAEAAYRKSLTELPEHAERLWGLGEALRRQDKLDDAILAYEAALVQRPALGEAEAGLTLVYAARRDYARALDHARRHAAINPGSTVAWRNVSDMALGAGDTDAAVAAATQWIALAPDDRDGHDARWQALFAAGRRPETIEALRASRQALPGDWNLTSTLAWMLAITPDLPASSAREAVELANEAVRLNPTHPRSHDILAAALASAGSYDDAVRAAQRALELADAGGAQQMRAAIQARLTLYQSHRPYRK